MTASVNCFGRFLKTNHIILRTFFTDMLGAKQFTLAKVTLNHFFNSVCGILFRDNTQTGQSKRDFSVDFFSLELVHGVLESIQSLWR